MTGMLGTNDMTNVLLTDLMTDILETSYDKHIVDRPNNKYIAYRPNTDILGTIFEKIFWGQTPSKHIVDRSYDSPTSDIL